MSRIPQRMLIVDDDPIHARVLTRSLRLRRFEVASVRGIEAALAAASSSPPDFVVLEQCLDGASGLGLIRPLKAINPQARVLVLTGCASIEKAVNAIKLGACHYLAKPAYVEEVLTGFGIDPLTVAAELKTATDSKTHSIREVEWKHIMRALSENNGNVSAAARALGMHRRTLQRKLMQYKGECAGSLVADIRERQRRRRRREMRAALVG